MIYKLVGQTCNLRQLQEHCDEVRERCRRQRITLRLEREALRMGALLRDHEWKTRRWRQSQKEIDEVSRRLIESLYQ